MKRIQYRLNKRRDIISYLFLFPSLMGVLILFIIPYLDVIRRSFMDGIGKQFVGFKNYENIFFNRSFRMAVFNTFSFLVICIPLLILLSLFIAVCLYNNKEIGIGMKSIFLLPMAVPVASIVILWNVLFTKYGFISSFLELFDVFGQNWMDTKYSFAILVFSYIWKNLGYDIILWIAALATIPSEIYESARVDGAGNKECFLYITIPNLVSSLFQITVLSLINGFKVFREAYLVAGDYPEEHIYMLQHLFNNWFRNLSIDKLAAGAVMTGAVLFGLIMLFQKFLENDSS